MTRIAYVNGHYVNQREATVSMEDRGYHFADGVYEYFAFYNGKILDEAAHLARLERSLEKIRIAAPMPFPALSLVMRELMDRSGRLDGGLYLQITRGVAKRDHPFPKTHVKPSLTMFISEPKTPTAQQMQQGVRVITQPDARWKHCDIKSIALLPNVLARQASVEAGAREAWLVREDGIITEGTASNSFIIKNGVLITHPADTHVLPGITREVVIHIARSMQIPVEERGFTVAEAKAAEEAFLTSTSPNVLPVVKIDDTPLGSGAPGPITKRLMAEYFTHIHTQTGKQFA